MKTIGKGCLLCFFLSFIPAVGNCQELEFKKFGETKPFKRGKSYLFSWSSGPYVEHVLTFQLKKGGITVMEWPEVENIESHEFMLPVSLKPGKDYNFNVIDQTGKLLSSQTLTIKRKIPLAIKFTPILIAGIVILALPKDKDDGMEFPGLPPLPEGN